MDFDVLVDGVSMFSTDEEKPTMAAGSTFVSISFPRNESNLRRVISYGIDQDGGGMENVTIMPMKDSVEFVVDSNGNVLLGKEE